MCCACLSVSMLVVRVCVCVCMCVRARFQIEAAVEERKNDEDKIDQADRKADRYDSLRQHAAITWQRQQFCGAFVPF
jgi:heme exporter protein D